MNTKSIRPDYRASIPIQALKDLYLPALETARLTTIAEQLREQEPTLQVSNVFGERVSCGLSSDPALIIGIHHDIPLVEKDMVSSLEYRMSLLGQDGDLICLRGRRQLAYEHYREHQLGLGMRLAQQTNLSVNIAAAPPRLTNRVNNKLWFARLVGAVLGATAAPAACAAYGPSALAALVKNFVRRYCQCRFEMPAFCQFEMSGFCRH